jgi:hypothetical protein
VRSSVLVLLAACGSASNPSSPPAVADDEVATPTEQAAAPAMPQQAVIPVANPSFPGTCNSIAAGIEKIARQYSQLINFRAADQKGCTIRYQHRTHAPARTGGWSSGVPHPDADGVWFYIGIYDPNGPDAESQIHTQPVVPNWWIGPRKVMFLILEGEKTKPAAAAISKILERHGLVTR